MKTILVTGNQGYIGSVLAPMISQQGYNTVGLDTNLYRNCAAFSCISPKQQIAKDIREVTSADLKGIDCIIHLAALSNDPLGELNPQLTQDINYRTTVRLAKLAQSTGVKRFIFASTQSIYGISDGKKELKEDDRIQPVTEYAKTKWLAEVELREIASENFTVTCLRPSTVYGPSPKLRCDILLNNLVGYAYTTGKIVIKSDGSPFRPVVHINNVCRAFVSCLEAPPTLINAESFNVGIPNSNYSVAELANLVKCVVPHAEIEFAHQQKDSRTYRVCFDKISTQLKSFYYPCEKPIDGIKELLDFYEQINLVESDFEGPKYIRLKQLQSLLKAGELDADLRWKN